MMSNYSRFGLPRRCRRGRMSVRESQKLKIVCIKGTQPVIPPVYGVIMLP